MNESTANIAKDEIISEAERVMLENSLSQVLPNTGQHDRVRPVRHLRKGKKMDKEDERTAASEGII